MVLRTVEHLPPRTPPPPSPHPQPNIRHINIHIIYTSPCRRELQYTIIYNACVCLYMIMRMYTSYKCIQISMYTYKFSTIIFTEIIKAIISYLSRRVPTPLKQLTQSLITQHITYGHYEASVTICAYEERLN